MAHLKLRKSDRDCLHVLHELITKDPFNHCTIESLAYNLGINRTKLSTGFKELFGVSVYEYRLQLRMEKAEWLLLETDEDVQIIASLTGYKTKSSFTIAFKKTHKIPPHQWRKENSMQSM